MRRPVGQAGPAETHLFVAGPFNQTLPLRIWNSVLFGLDPTVTAVSTLLIGLTVLVLGGSALLRGRAAYR